VATTNNVDTSSMVAMLDNGTLLMAHVALTTTGEDHVDGTEILT
jgi:hypothetical protein